MVKNQENFEELNKLAVSISGLKNNTEIAELICKFSLEVENANSVELRSIRERNELYVDIISNVFGSEIFINNLENILKKEYNEDPTSEMRTIQLLLRLSFFMVCTLIPVLDEVVMIFIRKRFGSLVKYAHAKINDRGTTHSLQRLLVILEKANFDSSYKILPKVKNVVPNPDFLAKNLILSRLLIGELLVYKIGYWSVPEILDGIVTHGKHPGSLFLTAYKTEGQLSGYRNYDYVFPARIFNQTDKKAAIRAISMIQDRNVNDLFFLIGELSLDYRDRPSLEKSVEKKIAATARIKEKILHRFKNLSVFKDDAEMKNEWINKIFINTIRFLSVSESIKNAKNYAWMISTFMHFHKEWLEELHGVINFHNLKPEENIIVYVEGESDKLILENAYKKLYPKHHEFIFYGTGGKRELYQKINASQISDLGRIAFGVFDFDSAFNDFNGLKNGFDEIEGSEESCIFRRRVNRENKIFALLLPVSNSRKNIASRQFRENSLLSMEMLFEDDVLKDCGNLKSQEVPGGLVNMFWGNKAEFAQKTGSFKKDAFSNFAPLFMKLIELSRE